MTETAYRPHLPTDEVEFVTAHTEYLPPREEFMLTAEQIQSSSYDDLIITLATAIDSGQIVPPAVLEGVMAVHILNNSFDEGRHNLLLPDDLPETGGSPMMHSLEESGEEHDSYGQVLVAPGELSTFPNGLYTSESDTSGVRVITEGFARLDTESKKRFITNAIPRLDGIDQDDEQTFINEIMRTLQSGADRQEMESFLAKYLYDNRSRYPYAYFDQLRASENHLDMIARQLLSRVSPEKALSNIVSLPLEQQKILLGMMVDSNTYSYTLNMIREVVEHTQDPHLRAQSERIGRLLLGLNPEDSTVPFHVSLNKLYDSIKFKEYKPNQAATEADLGYIEQAEAAVSPDLPRTLVTLDVGCGTGRLAIPLAQRGETDVVALDVSESNLAVARADAERALEDIPPDVRPRFIKRNMLDTGLPDKSVRKAYSLGRTLSHLEDSDTFALHINEMDRLIPEGGVYIFDMPDRDSGSYLENRKKLLPVFRDIGLPIDDYGSEEDFLERLTYLVDGPDDVNQYNRLVLDDAMLEHILRSRGFTLSRLQEYDVAKDQGERAIVYIAKKQYDNTIQNTIRNQSHLRAA